MAFSIILAASGLAKLTASQLRRGRFLVRREQTQVPFGLVNSGRGEDDRVPCPATQKPMSACAAAAVLNAALTLRE